MSRPCKYLEQGQRLRAAREAKGWSQRITAERLGVSASTYAPWEHGRACPDKISATLIKQMLGLKLKCYHNRSHRGRPKRKMDRPPYVRAIRAKRKGKGLSARQVSLMADLNPDTLGGIEQGRVKRPQPRVAYRVAEILGMDPAEVGNLPRWADATASQRLRVLRYRRGWTTVQAADRAGLDRSTVNVWENGRIPNDTTFVDYLTQALCGRNADVLLGPDPLETT